MLRQNLSLVELEGIVFIVKCYRDIKMHCGKEYLYKILVQEEIYSEQFKIHVGHLRHPARHLSS